MSNKDEHSIQDKKHQKLKSNQCYIHSFVQDNDCLNKHLLEDIEFCLSFLGNEY